MNIQSGNTFLNNPLPYKKSQDRFASEEKSFDKLLAKTDKKKPLEERAEPKQKNNSNDISGGEQNHIEDRNRVGSQREDSAKISKTEPRRPESKESMVEERGSVGQRQQVLEESSAVKNLEGQENQASDLLSINQSVSQEKSLEENDLLQNNFQKSFEEIIAKGQQNQQGSQPVAAGLGVDPRIENSGKIKLDSSIKINENFETLSGTAPVSRLTGKSQESEGSELQDQTTDLESMFTQHMEQDNGVSEAGTAVFAEELSQAELGKGEKIENMNSIVKQARAFVAEGGGTMEIHLQPEGMGKVHLKVAVQDGAVNVEMLADNQVAKRALEDGLFDIKQALEGQKLLVETLKVEMSPDYEKDFSDLENHMQEQANRDFAEEFLDQFQQQREERVGGMFDGLRNFQSRPDEPELLLNNKNPYSENGKGRSLNIMA